MSEDLRFISPLTFLLRYGRKLTFFSSKALLTVFSLVLIASNSWEMFCVVYCFVGMMDVANYCTAFILGWLYCRVCIGLIHHVLPSVNACEKCIVN